MSWVNPGEYGKLEYVLDASDTSLVWPATSASY